MFYFLLNYKVTVQLCLIYNRFALRGRGGFHDTLVLSVTETIWSPPICNPLTADWKLTWKLSEINISIPVLRLKKIIVKIDYMECLFDSGVIVLFYFFYIQWKQTRFRYIPISPVPGLSLELLWF